MEQEPNLERKVLFARDMNSSYCYVSQRVGQGQILVKLPWRAFQCLSFILILYYAFQSWGMLQPPVTNQRTLWTRLCFSWQSSWVSVTREGFWLTQSRQGWFLSLSRMSKPRSWKQNEGSGRLHWEQLFWMWGRQLMMVFRMIGDIFYFRDYHSGLGNSDEINLL